MDDAADDLPAWWRRNRRLKAELGLPEYEPPRFADGTYTHEVVPRLEAEFDCTVLFIGIDVRHLDDWEVRIDGETAFEIGRHRARDGNTVYELSAAEFERAVREAMADRG